MRVLLRVAVDSFDKPATPTKQTCQQMLTGPSVIALEVSGGVDGPVLDHHFKVKMAASGVTGGSDSAYPTTLAQGLTLRNADAGQVVVCGLQALAVVNNNPVSAAVRAPACLRYLSGS